MDASQSFHINARGGLAFGIAGAAAAAPVLQTGDFTGSIVYRSVTGAATCPSVGSSQSFTLTYRGLTRPVVLYRAVLGGPNSVVLTRFTFAAPATGFAPWGGIVKTVDFPAGSPTQSGSFSLTLVTVAADSFNAEGTLAVRGSDGTLCTSDVTVSAAKSGKL